MSIGKWFWFFMVSFVCPGMFIIVLFTIITWVCRLLHILMHSFFIPRQLIYLLFQFVHHTCFKSGKLYIFWLLQLFFTHWHYKIIHLTYVTILWLFTLTKCIIILFRYAIHTAVKTIFIYWRKLINAAAS